NRTYTNNIAENTLLPNFKEILQLVITFGLTVIAWVFFRAESVSHALQFLTDMFSMDLFLLPDYTFRKLIYPILLLLIFFIATEWLGRRNKFAIETITNILPRPIRWMFYSFILFLIGMFMQTTETPFIYFQF